MHDRNEMYILNYTLLLRLLPSFFQKPLMLLNVFFFNLRGFIRNTAVLFCFSIRLPSRGLQHLMKCTGKAASLILCIGIYVISTTSGWQESSSLKQQAYFLYDNVKVVFFSFLSEVVLNKNSILEAIIQLYRKRYIMHISCDCT